MARKGLEKPEKTSFLKSIMEPCQTRDMLQFDFYQAEVRILASLGESHGTQRT
jgi:hypothetical protein